MPETRKSRPKPGLFDRLTLGVSAAYYTFYQERDEILPRNTPSTQMVSLKHCEIANPILLVALQERQKQNQNALPRVDHGLTPDRHDRHNRKVMNGTDEYRPLVAMSGKWGC